MKNQLYNDGWKFWADKNSFALVWNVPDFARDVELPHDAMIEQPAFAESRNGGNTGFRDSEVYVYVKNYYAAEEDRDKTLFLKFEGIYMNAFVYVNGQLAAKSPFGYSTFYADLSPFVKYGQDNEIRVQVRNGNMGNSRWYSGGGIYRDVYLLSAGPVYLVPEGLQIKTERIEKGENGPAEYAVLKIRTELRNRYYNKRTLKQTLTIRNADGAVVARDEALVPLYEAEERDLTRRFIVESPALWSEENPALHTCECVLTDAETGELIDSDTETFGIRVLAVDTKRGLTVNGQTVKLRGGCIHHDSGLLGAATYEEVQLRQIRKMKEAGFNAIRMSHNPMAPAMLRACDRLGMFVMDEGFDMWNRLKSDYDYGLYFKEWWPEDVKAMVRKDYNHPSVVLYSIGNEIPEIGTDQGAQLCHDMDALIKSLDDTRFTMAAINGVFAAGDGIGKIIADISADMAASGDAVSGNVNDFMTIMDTRMDDIVTHEEVSKRLDKACAYLDVAGYNYMTARYLPDGKDNPNRVIVGSETYPPMIARNWDLVEKLPYVIGDFTWTGWDYIGEAGVGIPAYHWGDGGFGARFPAQLAYPGDFDITGFRRPASYFREAVFGRTNVPHITVQNPAHYGEFLIKTPWVISDAVSSWTWQGMEEKPAIVEIYAGGEEAELIQDGVSLGRKPSGKAAGFRTLFETVYRPGKLEAVVYENGAEIGRSVLETAKGTPKLTITREEGNTDEKLVFLQIELKGENGVIYTDRDVEITLEASEGAVVRGFGSGDPKPAHNFADPTAELFYGRGQIIVEKPKPGSSITLKVSAASGECAGITL